MATPIAKRSFIFPNVPRGQKVVDKDGNMNEVWADFFDLLSSQLNDYYNVEGLKIPALLDTEIVLLTGDGSNNRFLFNQTDNTLRYNLNGIWKTVNLI